MADTKISALTDGGAVQNTDQIPVSRSGVNFRVQVGTAAAAATGDFATAAQGVKADSAVQPTIVDAKGDLIVATAADTLSRLAVGSNTFVLTADSAEATGLKWAAPSGGGLPTGITSPGDGALNYATGAITADRPSVNITQTWNNAAATFTGMRFNVTDTASNAASLLADFQVGGASRFNIRKSGAVAINSNGLELAHSSVTAEIFTNAGSIIRFYPRLAVAWGFATGYVEPGITLGFSGSFAWTSTNPDSGTSDLRLYRDAANTLAQRNGTNAQTFRIYNTFTDASNYERGFMRYASNVLEIGHERAGTGVARNMRIMSGFSTSIWGSFLTLATEGGVVCGTLVTSTAGVFRYVDSAGSAGIAYESLELAADPAAPATNAFRLYARDNGSGKTQLCVRFATGAVQVLATEP